MVAKGKVVNGKAKDGGPLEPFMVFYEAKWNPWAPPNPGSHGILHHSLYYPPTIPAVYHSEYPFDETLRTPTPNGAPLFVRQGPNKWEYLGHYRWHRSRPLTGAEWSSLPLQTKKLFNPWGHPKDSTKRLEYKSAIRAHLGMREDEDASLAQFDMAMTAEAVQANVDLLECVGYRQDFIDRLNQPLSPERELEIEQERKERKNKTTGQKARSESMEM